MATETTTPQAAERQRSGGTGFRTADGGQRKSGRWSAYRYLLWVRLLELKREPEIVFWVFGFPLLLSLGLGIAFRNKPAGAIHAAVVSGDYVPQVVSLLHGSTEHSQIQTDVVDLSQAKEGLRLGKYDLVIEPPREGQVVYDYDPARPESVVARDEVDRALQSALGRKDVVVPRFVESSEPGSRYIDFLIPGLIGMGLMNSGMWGVGFALVDMRQRKLLKRFVATPMRRSDFLLAVMSSRLVLMVIEVGLLLAFGVFVFHLPVMGSLVALAVLGAIAAITFGSLGLLAACRAQKVETASGLINLVMMPMWIFSGVFFSSEHFPAMAQPFIKALPLTALNDALRAIILEGASLPSQGLRLLVLAVWGGISFALALKWFRWV